MEKLTIAKQPTRVRFRILAFLFINVVINYMDRINLSVAATGITEDFHLSPVQLGLLFSAFGWTYAAFKIPGGVLVDRIIPRILYSVSLISWSLVTLCLGLVKGFTGLLGFRLAVGVAPKHLIGLTGGVFNFIGNLASIVVPLVIGLLVNGGNFKPALIFIGIITITGACSYIFLVGKIERINVEDKLVIM